MPYCGFQRRPAWAIKDLHCSYVHLLACCVAGDARIAAGAVCTAVQRWEAASTFCVQASDCLRSMAMVAAALLLVGRTENLFSSCISSLRASLSVLSFSMAALQAAAGRSVTNFGVETSSTPTRV